MQAQPDPSRRSGFSLIEVVLALGVIAFALLAILGLLPLGLATGRSAQDETRAAQIAQDIMSSLTSQAPLDFGGATIVQQSTGFTYDVPLDRDYQYDPLGASNEGNLAANYSADLPYQILLRTERAVPGFDPGYACKVTVRVAWQPFAQNYRDFVQIISRY